MAFPYLLAMRKTRAYTPNYVHMPPTHLPASSSPRAASPRPAAASAAQRAGAPSPACACGRLRRATRALTQLYDDAMAPAGLRITQFSLLRTLTRDGPLRISELAARQLLDRTALSRNLDPLVQKGCVEIVAGRDARTREVAITRSGSATLRAAEPYWMQAQREVSRHLGIEKLDALIAVLGELEDLHPSAIAQHDEAGAGKMRTALRRNRGKT